jgi:hypothetical protein
MVKLSFLKLKSRWYVFILGMLNILSFTFILGCINNTDNQNKINESLAKEKHIQDSIANSYRVKDSLAHLDSINRPEPINNNFKPVNNAKKYGIRPADFKKK